MNYHFSVFLFILFPYLIFSHPKGDKLRKLTFESENGLIKLNEKMYKEYVLQHPRPYDFVILYSYSINCNSCPLVEQEFNKVALTYKEKLGFKPDMINKKRAVFFGIIRISDKTYSLIEKLKFNYDINILYTTPKNIQNNEFDESYIEYDQDYIMSYKDNSENIFALKIIEFINAKSQRKFDLRKDPIEYLFYFFIFITSIFIVYSWYINYKDIFLSPITWLIGSLVIYIFGIGGIVYSILNSPPFFGFDNNRKIHFISSNYRNQFFFEGIYMSIIFVIGATFFYAFNWGNYFVERNINIDNYGFCLVIGCFAIFELILYIYNIKISWFNPSLFPPEGYVKGPLINDQGNSF